MLQNKNNNKKKIRIMLKDKIDGMIMSAMKNENIGVDVEVSSHVNLVNALKQIKVELVKAEKSGKPFDEIEILKRLKKQHEESIEAYKANGRDELAANESDELSVIKAFLPKEVGADVIEREIEELVDDIRKDHEPGMRDMGVIMGALKKKYPAIDGKIVSDIFKKIIG